MYKEELDEMYFFYFSNFQEDLLRLELDAIKWLYVGIANYTNLLIILFAHILIKNLSQFHKWCNKILIILKQ